MPKCQETVKVESLHRLHGGRGVALGPVELREPQQQANPLLALNSLLASAAEPPKRDLLTGK